FSSKDEFFAKHFAKKIELEFLETYREDLTSLDTVVEIGQFTSFEENTRRIYQELITFYRKDRKFLDFFPTTITLPVLNELFSDSIKLIEGFPNTTIRVIQDLNKRYEGDLQQKITFSLGKYFGVKVIENKFKNKIGITPYEILKLINEISVCRYDNIKEQFNILICPICRGKRSNKPICQFFEGFIEGSLNNPKLYVKEIECRAKGNQSCKFKVMRH
ncbi:MAG: V4R domain-containing protein, partial [Candidatus Hodarchaeota archaeon]